MSSLLGMIGGMIGGLFGSRPHIGQNPLNHAVRAGNLAKTMDLVREGHSINEEDVNMYTPLEIAIRKGHREIFDFFLMNNCKMDYSEALDLATKIGQEAIRDLIVAKVMSSDHNRDGYTPFHLAAQTGNEEMMRELLSRGADDINQATSYGYAPLHLAVKYGHHAVAKLLLEHGADVNKIVTIRGIQSCQTSLHTVIEYRREDVHMMKLLLDHGAAVSDEIREFATIFGARELLTLMDPAAIEERGTGARAAPQPPSTALVVYAGGASAGASDPHPSATGPQQPS